MYKLILFLFLSFSLKSYSQEIPIKIVDEEIRNRLALYAVNESETDYDVLVTVSGTGFKQRAGKPRWMFVPSASKVLINTLIIERGKEVQYTYELQLNDSLSRRSLRREIESIRIKPKRQITIYQTKDCRTCDTILNSLARSKYQYNSFVLSEKPKMQQQIEKALTTIGSSLDSIYNPVISLSGKLYIQIEDYESLLNEVNKDDDQR